MLFAGLLLGVCIIFSIQSYFYTYVDPDQLDNAHSGESGKEDDDRDDFKKKTKDIELDKKKRSTKL